MIVKYVDVNGFVTVVTCTNCETDQETTCHNVNWTYEKIYDTSLLKKGDHICCHRPYVIWHHGIVTNVEGEKQIVHYSGNSTVVEGTMQDFTTSRCCNCFGKEFNSLYRVNYMDCYNSEYTILRARSLRGEKRYNLFDRNCEHFSRWCKTGSTSSSQISIAWSSLGKLVLTIGLKAIGLLIVLGLIQYSHESQEEMVTLVGVGGTEQDIEKAENILLTVYIAVMTFVFVIYLLKTSFSRLGTVIRDDSANPRPRQSDYCTKSSRISRLIRFCCSLWCCYFCDDVEVVEQSRLNRCGRCNSSCATRCRCCLLSCRSIIRCLFCDACKHVRCCPCTCYRRQGHLVCGLFARIVTREVLAACGTVSIMWNEETITNAFPYPPFARTSIQYSYPLLC